MNMLIYSSSHELSVVLRFDSYISLRTDGGVLRHFTFSTVFRLPAHSYEIVRVHTVLVLRSIEYFGFLEDFVLLDITIPVAPTGVFTETYRLSLVRVC